MNTQTIESQKVNTLEKVEVSSYPYGRLRTKAYFSIEFNPKHGFRSVFQTINPKNGVLNKPSKSTYGFFMYSQVSQKEDGDNFVEVIHIRRPHDLNTIKGLKETVKQILETGLDLTPEMIKYLAENFYLDLKINLSFTASEERAAKLETFKPYMSILVDMIKNPSNRLNELLN